MPYRLPYCDKHYVVSYDFLLVNSLGDIPAGRRHPRPEGQDHVSPLKSTAISHFLTSLQILTLLPLGVSH